MKYHLAQTNIGIAQYSYEDSRFAEFVDNLDRINALADQAPGFVWRYVAEDETEAGTGVFGIADMLFNMSVWESIESLEAWVYGGKHLDVVRQRARWFEKSPRSPLVLWWIDKGNIPTIEQAGSRFELLWNNGPSPQAFTFAKPHPA